MTSPVSRQRFHHDRPLGERRSCSSLTLAAACLRTGVRVRSELGESRSAASTPLGAFPPRRDRDRRHITIAARRNRRSGKGKDVPPMIVPRSSTLIGAQCVSSRLTSTMDGYGDQFAGGEHRNQPRELGATPTRRRATDATFSVAGPPSAARGG